MTHTCILNGYTKQVQGYSRDNSICGEWPPYPTPGISGFRRPNGFTSKCDIMSKWRSYVGGCDSQQGWSWMVSVRAWYYNEYWYIYDDQVINGVYMYYHSHLHVSLDIFSFETISGLISAIGLIIRSIRHRLLEHLTESQRWQDVIPGVPLGEPWWITCRHQEPLYTNTLLPTTFAPKDLVAQL